MQMVKKVFLGFLLIWGAFLMFMPKAEFYYAIEDSLAKKDIRLNEKSIDEGLFTLTLNEVTLYVKGIELAKVKKIEFFTLLFYTSVTLDGVETDETLHTKVPAEVSEARAKHILFMPTTLAIDANGTFGGVEGEVDLLDSKVRLDFVQIQEIDVLKPLLKKDEKGWYYEGSF